MRKSIFLLCGMLCCFQAFLPGAEAVASEPGSDTQWLIIPRAEFNPYLPLKEGGYKGYDFGYSSLYGLFEGGIGNSNFSYSLETHFLSTDPKSLYQNTFYSEESSWLDCAKLSYQAGNWDFNVGKDMIAIGTFEIDEYDFDSHINLSSTVWNNLSSYQWGASVGYTTNDEVHHFALQASSSPFSEHPFSSTKDNDALYAYSFQWRADFDAVSTLNSFNAMEWARGEFIYATALGVLVPLGGDLTLGADFVGRGYDKPSLFSQEATILASVQFEPSDRLSLKVKAGYEFNNSGEDIFGYFSDEKSYVPTSFYSTDFCNEAFFFGGLQVHYYPLRDNQNLRLHGVIAANNYAKSLSLNIGATYYLDLYKFSHR